MSDFNLTQAEADALFALEKRRIDETIWTFPGLAASLSIPLASTDGRENFTLDLRRGRIDLGKGTYQNRGRQVIVLARLDFGGQPHRNPDGAEIGSPHLHLYREGYGDKWAFQLPPQLAAEANHPWRLFEAFLKFCNVVEAPTFERGLF